MEIEQWRKTKLHDQLDKLQVFHDAFQETSLFFKKTISDIEMLKADSTHVQRIDDRVNNWIKEIDVK